MQLFFGWLGWLLTLAGGYLAVLGAVLCLSTGLYYAAELAEEHSVLTGRLLKHATKAVLIGHGLLWLDGWPFGRVLVGALCHGGYAWLLNDYPRLELASPAFVVSVVAFLVDHYSWFRHLADPLVEPMPFVNSLGFFALFVWLVPFSLFVSLSINDNELPLGASSQTPKSTNAFRRLADAVRGGYRDAVQPGLGKAAQYVAPAHDKRW